MKVCHCALPTLTGNIDCCKNCNNNFEITDIRKDYVSDTWPILTFEDCQAVEDFKNSVDAFEKETKDQNIKVISEKFKEWAKNQKDIPQEYVDIINENFWELI